MKIEQIKWLKRVFVSTLLISATLPSLQAQKVDALTTVPPKDSKNQLKKDPSSRLQVMLAEVAAKRKANMLLKKQQPLLAPANQSGVQSVAGSKKNIEQSTYTFTGSGSWFKASNWENNRVPPANLKAGDHIIIDTKKACVFNDSRVFVLVSESSLEVRPGTLLYVSIGNNLALRGGAFINNGTVKILSGQFNVKDPNAAAGKFVTTSIARITSPKTGLPGLPSTAETPDLKKK